MDAYKLSALLRACAASRSLAQGRLLHAKSIALGLLIDHDGRQDEHSDRTARLAKSLISFYVSLGHLGAARAVLDSLPGLSDVSLWNALIAAYSKSQLHHDCLLLFRKLHRLPHLAADCYTYPSVLKACGALGRAGTGESVHAAVLRSGFGSDVVVSSSLVGMYAKCDRFGSAAQLFDEMVVKDVACWNTVMSCYYQSGQAVKALELFDNMKNSGFRPDSVTYTTAFSACARLGNLAAGKRIHEELVASGFVLDAFVRSAIVDLYAKCGCLEIARVIFERIPDKSVVSWNSMIGGYSLRGDSDSCLEIFSRMILQGVKPTSTTVSNLLMACCRSSHMQHGKLIHGYLLRNHMDFDIFVSSALLDLYFKCGNVGYAEAVFNRMQGDNVVSWNVMISGYVGAGLYFRALDVFHQMRPHGVKPDSITFSSILPACAQLAALEQGREIHKKISEYNLENNEMVMCSLLDMYAKCGAVEEAREVFSHLPNKDVVSFTSMIMAYGSHGQAYEALELFNEMQKTKAKPDQVSFLAVLSACSHGGLVDEGRHYFNLMMCNYGLRPGIEHYSCLIDLLGRSGRLHEAYSMITNTNHIKADSGLLGSLFSACILHKNLEIGEQIARLLINLDPDDHSTYIGLANMYASAGKWDGVRKVRTVIKERRLKKNPGCSWIEVDKRIHQFFVKEELHPQIELIYECLSCLSQHMEKAKSQSLTWKLDQLVEL